MGVQGSKLRSSETHPKAAPYASKVSTIIFLVYLAALATPAPILGRAPFWEVVDEELSVNIKR